PSLRRRTANSRAARIGPTVCELDGPMPILKRSKTLTATRHLRSGRAYNHAPAVCAAARCESRGEESERLVADDPCALEVSHRRPEILHRVVLGATVVPDRDAVATEAEAHLVLGHRGLAEQVVEQIARARGVVLAETHVLCRVEV